MDFSSIASNAFAGAARTVSSVSTAVSTKAAELQNRVGEVFDAVISKLQATSSQQADITTKHAADLQSASVVDRTNLPQDVADLYSASQAYTGPVLSAIVRETGISSQQRECERVPGEEKAEQNKLKETVAELVRSKVLFPLSGKKDTDAVSRLENAALFFNDPQAFALQTAQKEGLESVPEEWQKEIDERVKYMKEEVPKMAAEVAKSAGKEVDKEKLTSQAKVVKIEVPGADRALAALHLTHGDGSGPTVVVFHANAMTADKMREQAQFYFEQGYNVLVPTMGGYPGSEGVATSVGSIKQDVSAINKHLESRGVERFGYHGLSMGGALALEAATANMGKTFFVCTDQTFDTPAGVFSNYLRNHQVPGPICSFAKSVANLATQGGLDNRENAEKVKKRNIPLVSVTVENDAMMAVKGKDSSETQDNIGALSKETARVHMTPGNHGDRDKLEHTACFARCGEATNKIEFALEEGLRRKRNAQ